MGLVGCIVMKKILIVGWIFVSLVPVVSECNELRVKKLLQEGLHLSSSLKEAQMIKGLSVATVGGDNFCTYRLGTTKIQDAIDSGVAEIRIASNTTYTENLTINDRSVTIKGGYSDCTQAASGNRDTVPVLVNGNAVANTPALTISGSTQRNTIILEYLEFRYGSGDVGAGISVSGANAEILMDTVYLRENTAVYSGGGMLLSGGDIDVSMVDSLILYNSAGTGGGIMCLGQNNSIVMSGWSSITQNTADFPASTGTYNGQGGGVFLSLGCGMILYSGTVTPGPSDFRGIANNHAYAEGGGVFVESGSTLVVRGYEYCAEGNCIGDNTSPASFQFNNSDEDATGGEHGGAIYATGSGTLVSMSAFILYDNVSGGRGGGIYLADQATLETGRVTAGCWWTEKCNYFLRNLASVNAGLGGAIFNDNSDMNVIGTIFEGNRADFGTAIYAIGNNATTRVEGGVFYHNGSSLADDYADNYVVRLADTTAEFVHSTFSENRAELATFGANSGMQSFKLYSSIVYDSISGDVMATGAGGIVDVDCLIAHELTSVPTATRSIIDDPVFVNPGDRNFHIDSVSSPAVDYCDNSKTGTLMQDIDFEIRGWDDPYVPGNIYGAYDVGADETYENDVIFKNGFD